MVSLRGRNGEWCVFLHLAQERRPEAANYFEKGRKVTHLTVLALEALTGRAVTEDRYRSSAAENPSIWSISPGGPDTSVAPHVHADYIVSA